MIDWNVLLKIGLVGLGGTVLYTLLLGLCLLRHQQVRTEWWIGSAVLLAVSTATILVSQGFTIEVTTKYSSGKGYMEPPISHPE